MQLNEWIGKLATVVVLDPSQKDGKFSEDVKITGFDSSFLFCEVEGVPQVYLLDKIIGWSEFVEKVVKKDPRLEGTVVRRIS